MNYYLYLALGAAALIFGCFLGYYARQGIARRQRDEIETTLQKKIAQAKKSAEEMALKADEDARAIVAASKNELESQRREFFNAEKMLLRREGMLEKKMMDYEEKEKEFNKKVEKLKEIKIEIENLKEETTEKLEKTALMKKEEAREELLKIAEKEYQKEILERLMKLEIDGTEKYQKKAKEILTLAIQKCALSQAQEITTTTVNLPSDEIKGRIIGKEGRNIKTLEKMTGVEIIVDDTPEAVVISGFDPIRRQIAKVALEKLIFDGRIQPARIEEMVQKAEAEISSQIKEAGERAVYEAGILDLDPKLVQLLGRLRFRTSYGQNVLLHSIEVSHLAAALASEVGANVQVAKKAGLLHDIGKAVDHQIQGSHVDIGIKILEKFGVEKNVVIAMKAHHEEYPYETVESIIVQTADQISGARPGARKDTLENYLKRLGELESIASRYAGVEKAYAIQAGRELRVFVKPDAIDDLGAKKIAREVANNIQEELKYPGEIKVIVIRENRVIEYAR